MSGAFAGKVGAVLSADIAVPEHEREVRFYSRVLSTGTTPLWREDLMNNLGMPIIGLGERAGGYADLPLQWMPHIQVADVAASVRSALDLGGSMLMQDEPQDGVSQWAVLMDPSGAAFGIIPVVSAETIAASTPDTSPDSAEPVGLIAWLDLTVPDASATRDFYRQVIGWTSQDVEIREGGEIYADYNMVTEDGKPAAGVCHSRGVNADLPPVWMIYLPVGDLAESLRRVRDEGGEVIRAVETGDGQYAYAAIRDPVGACFALVPG